MARTPHPDSFDDERMKDEFLNIYYEIYIVFFVLKNIFDIFDKF
jgi:hypothetical protein